MVKVINYKTKIFFIKKMILLIDYFFLMNIKKNDLINRLLFLMNIKKNELNYIKYILYLNIIYNE
jgi:hypothetical protein